jgi:hypothetical protein
MRAAVISVVGAALALGGAANSAPLQTRITAVTFTGSAARPIVTILGTGFGVRPRPAPSYRPTPPAGTAPPYGCSTKGNVGYDYGTRLWLADLASGRVWSAGRYRPSLNELDCVGLLIVSYTPTKVVYRLGVDYTVHHYRLAKGDPYQVGVNGALRRGVVR